VELDKFIITHSGHWATSLTWVSAQNYLSQNTMGIDFSAIIIIIGWWNELWKWMSVIEDGSVEHSMSLKVNMTHCQFIKMLVCEQHL
jgi:hypothetical protein